MGDRLEGTDRKDMEALDMLPLEMWRKIAMSDVDTWYRMIRAMPNVYSEGDRRIMKERNTRIVNTGTNVVHYLGDLVHRDSADGPAVYNGREFRYYRRGVLHRDQRQGPASYRICGGKTVYQRYADEGVTDRDPREGPAVIYLKNDCDVDCEACFFDRTVYPGGMVSYVRRGTYHRDPSEGPAIIEGEEKWYYWEGIKVHG